MLKYFYLNYELTFNRITKPDENYQNDCLSIGYENKKTNSQLSKPINFSETTISETINASFRFAIADLL